VEFHEIANLFPMMQPDELADLVADIKVNGLIEPIVTYEDQILDGRNRWLACGEAGVRPRFEAYEGDDALGFVVSKNLHRRHLNPTQLGVVARKIENMEQSPGINQYTEVDANLHEPKISRAKASKIVGVSPRTIASVKKVEEEAPELMPKLESGEMSAHKAVKIIKTIKAKEQFAEQTQTNRLKAMVEIDDAVRWLNKMPACDLLLTDPPYITDVDNIGEFAQWVTVGLNKVKDTGRAYIFIGAYPDELRAYLNVMPPEHIELFQVLIWTYKNTLGNNPKDRYKQNYQACLYYKGVNAPGLNCPITNEQWAVQEINAPDGRQGDRYHAWQKPLEIAERFVRHSTNEGDIVYDPYACTGTFLLAAARLGRIAKGCDISKENLQIAIDRGCVYA
jgi:hypothetical protein